MMRWRACPRPREAKMMRWRACRCDIDESLLAQDRPLDSFKGEFIVLHVFPEAL
jgi:hypothetical protein